MTPEQKEAKKARRRKRYSEDPEKYNLYHRKYRSEHKAEVNARYRSRRAKNAEEINASNRNRRAEHPEEHRAMMRKSLAQNVNKNGVTKHLIRTQSRKILFCTHDKLSDYEIHHCFGYEDQNKFIYIPRDLHLKIHQLLRDKNIPADSDHWNVIRDLVNSCEEYTYIRT